MYATNYFETMVLNAFNKVTAAGISKLYVALFFNNPGESGTDGVEVSYTGYTRQPITFTVPYAESGGIGIKNAADILWDTAPNDVGEARFVGIYDSQTLNSGNMLLYGELTIPLDIKANQQPSLYAGEILYISQGDFSIAFKTKYLNILRGQNLIGFTPHLALYDGDPESNGIELSGGAYARAPVTFGAPTMQVSGYAQIQNANQVRFNSPTSAWGLWAYTGIKDALNSGELVLKRVYASPETIQKNYVPQFNAGSIKVALN